MWLVTAFFYANDGVIIYQQRVAFFKINIDFWLPFKKQINKIL